MCDVTGGGATVHATHGALAVCCVRKEAYIVKSFDTRCFFFVQWNNKNTHNQFSHSLSHTQHSTSIQRSRDAAAVAARLSAKSPPSPSSSQLRVAVVGATGVAATNVYVRIQLG
jgi:hypothetical protein